MDRADLARRFEFHAANEVTGPQHEHVRSLLGAAAYGLDRLLPEGREKSLTMTKLEEAVMWANASIARSRGG